MMCLNRVVMILEFSCLRLYHPLVHFPVVKELESYLLTYQCLQKHQRQTLTDGCIPMRKVYWAHLHYVSYVSVCVSDQFQCESAKGYPENKAVFFCLWDVSDTGNKLPVIIYMLLFDFSLCLNFSNQVFPSLLGSS